jgi:hypothetical protein
MRLTLQRRADSFSGIAPGRFPRGSGRRPYLFNRCANGRCAAPFDYRKGRLFRFSRNVKQKSGHAVVHFWLCAKCAKVYTLEYREKSGAAVLRLKHPPARGHKAKAREAPSYHTAATTIE